MGKWSTFLLKQLGVVWEWEILLIQQMMMKKEQLKQVLPYGQQHDHDLSVDGQVLSVFLAVVGDHHSGGGCGGHSGVKLGNPTQILV